MLATLGGGPPEPLFNDVIDTITQDLKASLPWVSMIYEARKNQWFERNSVIKHGVSHARAWHEIVLKNAGEFVDGARLINARNACRILHDSQYEASKIEIHLELEFEDATKTIQTERKPDANQPIPDAEKLPFGLQRCDVPRWLKRPGFDKPVEIPEVYSAAMEALMNAAPNAVTDAKKDHLKASGCDTKNAPKKLRDVIDVIGLTIHDWTLRELKT